MTETIIRTRGNKPKIIPPGGHMLAPKNCNAVKRKWGTEFEWVDLVICEYTCGNRCQAYLDFCAKNNLKVGLHDSVQSRAIIQKERQEEVPIIIRTRGKRKKEH